MANTEHILIMDKDKSEDYYTAKAEVWKQRAKCFKLAKWIMRKVGFFSAIYVALAHASWVQRIAMGLIVDGAKFRFFNWFK